MCQSVVGSAKGVLLKQSWEVEAMLFGEWRAWGEEGRNGNYFSKQGVKKTTLNERTYRAMSEKNEGKDLDEIGLMLVILP